MQPARVLIVDDSALMRRYLRDMLASSSEIEVCGCARDGVEAIDMVQKLRPDIVTLDVDMPNMDGMTTLPAILNVHCVPVIMVSSLTQNGAEVTLNALEAGAVDFVAKPMDRIARNIQQVRDELVEKVLYFRGTTVRRGSARRLPPAAPVPTAPPPTMVADPGRVHCVVIGISTGGPSALQDVLVSVSTPFPPILIVQHMPVNFTGPFANRLNSLCPFDICEAVHGDEILPNRVLIAPGGRHLSIRKVRGRSQVVVGDGELVSGHRPSVDVLFNSAASIYGQQTLAVIMTGMGRDGVDGCKNVLAAGGQTLGQDAETSVVYGMNKAAYLEGAVQAQFALPQLARVLMSLHR